MVITVPKVPLSVAYSMISSHAKVEDLGVASLVTTHGPHSSWPWSVAFTVETPGRNYDL